MAAPISPVRLYRSKYDTTPAQRVTPVSPLAPRRMYRSKYDDPATMAPVAPVRPVASAPVPIQPVAPPVVPTRTPATFGGNVALDQWIPDSARSLAKGVIGLGEGLVGLGDAAFALSPGNLVARAAGAMGFGEAPEVSPGQILEDYAGYRPREAKEAIATYDSPELKAARAEVEAADGFFPTIEASLRNPSTIVQSTVESAPSMLGSAGLARGAIKLAPKLSPVLASAFGEGAVAGGQAAEGIRQETGTMTPQQAAIAVASGGVTAAISRIAGKAAERLKLADPDTLLAGVKSVADRNIAARVIGGMATEGLLEELPQSAQEQFLQNVASGKPWMEGVPEAAAAGALTGAAMGGAANVPGPVRGRSTPPPVVAPADPESVAFAPGAPDDFAAMLAGTPAQPAAPQTAPASPVAPPRAPIRPSVNPQLAQIVLDAEAQGRNAAEALERAGVPKKDVKAELARVRDVMPKPPIAKGMEGIDRKEDLKATKRAVEQFREDEARAKAEFETAAASFDQDPLARTRVGTPEETEAYLAEAQRTVEEANAAATEATARSEAQDNLEKQAYAPLFGQVDATRAEAQRNLEDQAYRPLLEGVAKSQSEAQANLEDQFYADLLRQSGDAAVVTALKAEGLSTSQAVKRKNAIKAKSDAQDSGQKPEKPRPLGSDNPSAVGGEVIVPVQDRDAEGVVPPRGVAQPAEVGSEAVRPAERVDPVFGAEQPRAATDAVPEIERPVVGGAAVADAGVGGDVHAESVPDSEVAESSAHRPGEATANGFKKGPVQKAEYRVTSRTKANDGVLLEKKGHSGLRHSFYVGKDGKLIDGDSVNVMGAGGFRDPRIWVPSNDSDRAAAAEILDRLGQIDVSDKKERPRLQQALKDLVAWEAAAPQDEQRVDSAPSDSEVAAFRADIDAFVREIKAKEPNLPHFTIAQRVNKKFSTDNRFGKGRQALGRRIVDEVLKGQENPKTADRGNYPGGPVAAMVNSRKDTGPENDPERALGGPDSPRGYVSGATDRSQFEAGIVRAAQELPEGTRIYNNSTDIEWTVKKHVSKSGTKVTTFDSGRNTFAVEERPDGTVKVLGDSADVAFGADSMFRNPDYGTAVAFSEAEKRLRERFGAPEAAPDPEADLEARLRESVAQNAPVDPRGGGVQGQATVVPSNKVAFGEDLEAADRAERPGVADQPDGSGVEEDRPAVGRDPLVADQAAQSTESVPQRIKVPAKSLESGDVTTGSQYTILGVVKAFVAKDETQKGKVEVTYRTKKGEVRVGYWRPGTEITVDRAEAPREAQPSESAPKLQEKPRKHAAMIEVLRGKNTEGLASFGTDYQEGTPALINALWAQAVRDGATETTPSRGIRLIKTKVGDSLFKTGDALAMVHANGAVDLVATTANSFGAGRLSTFLLNEAIAGNLGSISRQRMSDDSLNVLASEMERRGMSMEDIAGLDLDEVVRILGTKPRKKNVTARDATRDEGGHGGPAEARSEPERGPRDGVPEDRSGGVEESQPASGGTAQSAPGSGRPVFGGADVETPAAPGFGVFNVGDRVQFDVPSIENGNASKRAVSGRVERILESGDLEIRTQNDGIWRKSRSDVRVPSGKALALPPTRPAKAAFGAEDDGVGRTRQIQVFRGKLVRGVKIIRPGVGIKTEETSIRSSQGSNLVETTIYVSNDKDQWLPASIRTSLPNEVDERPEITREAMVAKAEERIKSGKDDGSNENLLAFLGRDEEATEAAKKRDEAIAERREANAKEAKRKAEEKAAKETQSREDLFDKFRGENPSVGGRELYLAAKALKLPVPLHVIGKLSRATGTISLNEKDGWVSKGNGWPKEAWDLAPKVKAAIESATAPKELEAGSTMASEETPNGSRDTEQGSSDAEDVGGDQTTAGESPEGLRPLGKRQPKARPGPRAPRADNDGVEGGSRDGRRGPDADERPGVQPPDGSGEIGDSGAASTSVEGTVPSRRPAQPRPPSGARDFVITDEDDLGAGGKKAKFRGNLEAIRLAKELEAEKRSATPAEQKVLSRFVGWGGLKEAFNDRDDKWTKEYAELRDVLTADEYRTAAASVLNAHFTSKEIVKGFFKAAKRFGLAGRAKALESSAGVGNFIGLGGPNIRWTAIERDALTNLILRNLYPEQNVLRPTGFEAAAIDLGKYDFVLGNPPFGNERVTERIAKGIPTASIHNFFLMKSIAALRPGGIMGVVVSNSFLDSYDSTSREWIADRANFLGAIRLPNNAFLKNAGTEVTTDMVFFQKLPEGQQSENRGWVEATDYDNAEGENMRLNRYFVENPTMMLGDMKLQGTMYRANTPALVGRPGTDFNAALDTAIEKLPADIYRDANEAADAADDVDGVIPPKTKVSSLFITPDGRIGQRLPDVEERRRFTSWPAQNATQVERVRGLAAIRDAVIDLVSLEKSDATFKEIEAARKELNGVYDRFVKKYGLINEHVNRRAFFADPDLQRIEALESDYEAAVSAAVAKKYGETARPAKAKKADIFSKRLIFPTRPTVKADTPNDALVASLNERGLVDMPFMASILGKTEDQVAAALKGVIYQTPDGDYQSADEYLSGNVKAKLAAAQKALEAGDKSMEENVEALTAVIPEDKTASQIRLQPNSPWIPERDIADFIKHLFGGRPHVTKIPATGRVIADVADAEKAKVERWTATIQVKRGASGFVPAEDGERGVEFTTSGVKIFEALLTGNPIQVRTPPDDNGGTELVKPATDAVEAKSIEMAQEFQDWIWADSERRDRLERLYNDTFNTNVDRKYKGAHLTLPGSSEAIALRPHQKDFIWRAVQDPSVLADHVVGAGKTFAAAGAVMEAKRLGIARKVLIVVPNHTLPQWRDDFIKLYPNANVLMATEKDFEKKNRKRLFGKISNGDWDAVVIGHSSIGKIGMPQTDMDAVLSEQLQDMEETLRVLAEEKTDKNIIRQIQNTMAKLQDKMERLKLKQKGKDEGVTFDELGVDGLVIDEAHEFKNLFYTTGKRNIAGLGSPEGVGKTFDLFVKMRYLSRRYGDKAFRLFLTGTPVSNSLVEMFNMQRYMMYDELKRLGIHTFDAWANVFGNMESVYEVDPSGTRFRLSQRFSKFTNLPALGTLYRRFADVISMSDLKKAAEAEGKRFPVPKVKGGRPQIVAIPRSPLQAWYFGQLLPKDDRGYKSEYPAHSILGRMERFNPKESKKDNPLKTSGDARMAALDMRLVLADAQDNPNSKVNIAAGRIYDIWEKWKADKGTQLVFLDLSTPKSAKGKAAAKAAETSEAEAAEVEQDADVAEQESVVLGEKDTISVDDILADLSSTSFSVYDDLRSKLIARGIPAKEIAFIHDYDTSAKKRLLFKAVNDGDVRVLMGSTSKMGAGTNVQRRAVALHHLDAKFKPSEIEQREGRVIRQGNMLYERDPDGFEIEVLRYATQQTYDTRMWQLVEHKAKGIEDFKRGDQSLIELEEQDSEAINAADMKAAASGDPRIEREIKMRGQIAKLEAAKRSFRDAEYRKERDVRDRRRRAESMDEAAQRAEDRLKKHPIPPAAPFSFSVLSRGDVGPLTETDPTKILPLVERAVAGHTFVYRGTQFVVEKDSVYLKVRALLPGFKGEAPLATYYTFEDKISAAGLITRLNNFFDALAAAPAEMRKDAETSRRSADALEKGELGTFKDEAKLKELKAEHTALQQELKTAQGSDDEGVDPSIRPMFDRRTDEGMSEDAWREYNGITDDAGVMKTDYRDGIQVDGAQKGVRIVDFKKDVPAEILRTMAKNRAALASKIAMAERLIRRHVPAFRFGGFSPSGNMHGVNVNGMVFINDFATHQLALETMRSERITYEEAFARHLFDVITHEAAHYEEAGHGPEFEAELARIIDALGVPASTGLMRDFRRYAADGKNRARTDKMYQEALPGWREGERRGREAANARAKEASGSDADIAERLRPEPRSDTGGDSDAGPEYGRRGGVPASGRESAEGLGQDADVRATGELSRDGVVPAFARAWHGTPHKFDKFQFDDKVRGTGEGAQAYGDGLYFAESEAVGKQYANAFEGYRRVKVDPDVDPQVAALIPRAMIAHDKDRAAAARMLEATARQHDEIIRRFDGDETDVALAAQFRAAAKAIVEGKAQISSPNLYEVDIPDSVVDRMLDWDAPLSEQPESVAIALGRLIAEQQAKGEPFDTGFGQTVTQHEQKILAALDGEPRNNLVGYDAYHAISRRMGEATAKGWGERNQAKASELLSKAGIPGIKYLDGNSRGKSTFDVVNRSGVAMAQGFKSRQDAENYISRHRTQGRETVKEILQPGASRNFVVFDAKDVTILSRNGEKLTGQEKSDAIEDLQGQHPETAQAPKPSFSRKSPAPIRPIPDKKPKSKAEKRLGPVLKALPEAEEDLFKALYDRFAEDGDAPVTWEAMDKDALATLGVFTKARMEALKKKGIDFDAPGFRTAVRMVAEAQATNNSTRRTLEAAGTVDQRSREFRAHLASSAKLAGWVLAVNGDQTGAAKAFSVADNAMRTKDSAEEAASLIFKDVAGLSPKQAAEVVSMAKERPQDLAAVFASAFQPGFVEKVNEWRKGSMLFSLRTYGVNFFGNAMKQALTLAEIPLAAAADKMSNKGERQVYAGELTAARAGMADYGPAAFSTFLSESLNAIKGVEAFDSEANRLYEQRAPSIGGPIGKFIRTPFRLLQAADNFFKETAKAQSLYREAYRRAANQGLMGEALWKRVDEMIGIGKESEWKDPRVAGMMERAIKDSQYETFTLQANYDNAGAFGALADALGKAEKRVKYVGPLIGLAVPFKNTPANIAWQSFERTPFGFMVARSQALALRDLYKDLARAKPGEKADIQASINAKQRELSNQVARAAIGSTLFAMATALAAAGLLTGSGPPDWEKKKVWEEAGNQANSIKLGGTWYGYDRFEPIAAALAIAGNIPTIVNTEGGLDKMAAFAAAMKDAWIAKTYFQGLEDFADLVKDPQRYGASFLRDLEGSFVPAFVGQTAEDFDPIVRDKKANALAPITSRIPGLSQDLPAVHTGRGDFAKKTGRAAQSILPGALNPFGSVRAKSAQGDPLAVEMNAAGYASKAHTPYLEIGVGPTGAKRRERIDLTENEREAFRLADKAVSERFRRVISTQGWKNLDPDQKLAAFRKSYDKAAATVRDQVLPAAAGRLREKLRSKK